MTGFKLAAFTIAIALCAAVAFVPDAALAAAPALGQVPDLVRDVFGAAHYIAPVIAGVAYDLPALRTKLDELTAKARAKAAEIKDDTPQETRTQIEGEHAALLAQVETFRAAIATEEAAARATPANPNAPANPASPAAEPAIAAAAGEAVRLERSRIADIRDIGRRAQLEAAIVDTAINDGTAVEAFRVQAFNALAQRSAATATNAIRVDIQRDERDTRRDGMRDAIVARLTRAGSAPGTNVTVPEHARAYGEMGFAEMAAECLDHRGNLRTARQVHDVIERAFHTTTDFPGIFVDAMNVRLLQRYRAAPATYRRIAALYTTTDFRPTHVVRAGDFPALQAVQESGEIKAGTFSESKEVFRVYPYGVKFNISRQMIINDALRAIDQMLGSAGDRVADWENVQVFTLLASGSGAGPTLATDSKRIFHTDHGNLAGTSAVISITSVGVGRASMMKQTTLDGIKANFTPATLLTGPDTLLVAEQLVTQITPAQSSNAVPDFIRRLVPIGDANITGTPWYLFADPAVAPCFVYGYLEGFEGPRLASEEVFDVQGLRVKLEHDFGVAGIDYRGGFRNAGA
jgi:hypothetical protein